MQNEVYLYIPHLFHVFVLNIAGLNLILIEQYPKHKYYQICYKLNLHLVRDGVVMATSEDIEAATRLMEYGKRYPNGIEISEGIAKSTIAGNIAAFNESAILVNTSGKRVVNEKSSNRNILEVELAQENQMLYLLMDQSTFDIFRSKLSEAGITENSMNEWLKNNGSTTPYFFHADSISELAAKAENGKYMMVY